MAERGGKVGFRTQAEGDPSSWPIELSINEGIAIITLNRPEKRNAWSWESARQFGEVADQIRFDESVRAVILRAEGPAFCAGVDFSMPSDRIVGRSPAEKIRNYYEAFRWVHERFGVFANLPQPTIGAIQGYCLGAGFEIALMCDIRVASDDVQFALPEASVGVSIDSGGDLRLAREIGPAWARLLAFTGRRIDAEQALRLGIVQQISRREELDAVAMGIAQEIAAQAPLAIQGIKRTINGYVDQGLSDALRFEAMSAAVEFVSEDMTKGYAAKASKTDADFEGC